MSNANQVALRFVEETVFGVTPSGPPKFTNLRFTDEDLMQETDSVSSREIRADRQVTDLIRTGIRGTGPIRGEQSYGAYDAFWEAALMSPDWNAPVTVTATDISAAAADNSLNSAGAGFGSLTVGSWIYISGFSGAGAVANLGWAKIVTKPSSSKITVAYKTLVDDAAGESVTIKQASQITNGTTFRSFAIEREYTDLANEFALFNGMFPETFQLDTETGGIVTCQFGFLGTGEVSGSATAGDGSPTAAPTEDVMNAIDDVTGIFENGATFDCLRIGIQGNNNARSRLRIGTARTVSIGVGSLDLTGTFQVDYASKTLFNKYLNWTSTSMAMIFTKNGRAYVFEMPRVKLSTGKRGASGGINTDVVADFGFRSILDSAASSGYTMKIARLVI